MPVRNRAFTIGAVFGALLGAMLGCLPGDHCSPGYDDTTQTSSACVGNVVVTNARSCGKEWAYREDCSLQAKVCVAGTCATSCTTDTDCTPFEYCAQPSPSWQPVNGRAACQRRLIAGSRCTEEPTHCEPGHVCVPPRTVGDAEGADAGVVDAASDAASTPKAPTVEPTATASPSCAQDCAHADAGPSICQTDHDMCFNNTPVNCHECVPHPSPACAAGELCVAWSTGAFCALARVLDPRCGTSAQFGFCDGKTLVTCRDGFPVKREDPSNTCP